MGPPGAKVSRLSSLKRSVSAEAPTLRNSHLILFTTTGKTNPSDNFRMVENLLVCKQRNQCLDDIIVLAVFSGFRRYFPPSYGEYLLSKRKKPLVRVASKVCITLIRKSGGAGLCYSTSFEPAVQLGGLHSIPSSFQGKWLAIQFNVKDPKVVIICSVNTLRIYRTPQISCHYSNIHIWFMQEQSTNFLCDKPRYIKVGSVHES